MKHRNWLSLVVLTLVLLLTAGCGGETGAPGDPGTPVVDGPFTVYDCDGEKVALLTELLDLVEVRVTPDLKRGVLLEVWEKHSLEDARKDGLADPEGVCGRVLQVRRYDRKTFRTVLREETVSLYDFQTKDAVGNYYALTFGREDQLYRCGQITEEDEAVWQKVSRLGELAQLDFHWRNTDHTPVTMEELGTDYRTLPDVGLALRSLQVSELKLEPQNGWNPDRESQLVAAMNRSAGKPITNRADRAFGHFQGQPDVWSLEMTWMDTYHISLSCSPREAPLVAVALWDERMWDAICLKDQELYDLVRYGRDSRYEVDQELYERHRNLLERTRQEIELRHGGNPGGLTDCQLVQLTRSFTHREEDGSLVAIYDVDFAMQAKDLTQMDWSGGLYPDGNFAVRGVSDYGQLAVRYRNGQQRAVAFLGRDRYYAPWLDNSDSWDYVSWLLNQAELGEINPVELIYQRDVDPSVLSSSERLVDTDSDRNATVLVRPRHEVDNFRYFVVEHLREDGHSRMAEGEALYYRDTLSPVRPLLVTLDLPEVRPTRGISFRVGDVYHQYAIGVDPDTGSLVCLPME